MKKEIKELIDPLLTIYKLKGVDMPVQEWLDNNKEYIRLSCPIGAFSRKVLLTTITLSESTSGSILVEIDNTYDLSEYQFIQREDIVKYLKTFIDERISE